MWKPACAGLWVFTSLSAPSVGASPLRSVEILSMHALESEVDGRGQQNIETITENQDAGFKLYEITRQKKAIVRFAPAAYLQSVETKPSVVGASAIAAYPGCMVPSYRPAGFLRLETEMRRASYYGLMSAVACEHGLPVNLFDAMIIQESRYNPYARSPKRAYGLAQLMPGTAASLGINSYNIVQNLRGGARYLKTQVKTFGQYHLALAAYNAGPSRIRNGRIPAISETRKYVDQILRNWRRLNIRNYDQNYILSGSERTYYSGVDMSVF